MTLQQFYTMSFLKVLFLFTISQFKYKFKTYNEHTIRKTSFGMVGARSIHPTHLYSLDYWLTLAALPNLTSLLHRVQRAINTKQSSLVLWPSYDSREGCDRGQVCDSIALYTGDYMYWVDWTVNILCTGNCWEQSSVAWGWEELLTGILSTHMGGSALSAGK